MDCGNCYIWRVFTVESMKAGLSGALVGNAACFVAYLIFAFNIVFCKTISNSGTISPMALFCMRSIGSAALFWLLSLFVARGEKIQRGDMWKVALASFLGLFLTQLAFLKAITMCTAVDASILTLLSPIMAMIIAAVALKDRITANGVLGLAISLAGVVFIVLNSVGNGSGAQATTTGGVILMLVNTLAFASYTGIFKPVIQKYHVVTFMKWMFLFSTIYALPFGMGALADVPYAQIPAGIWWRVAFVVVCATFISYFLIPIGQKRIKPMIVCMYVYVQPVGALAISLATGMETMSWAKGLAALCVFLGVGIVNFSRNSKTI